MRGDYNFLKLNRIVLRNFSLYRKSGRIHEVDEVIDRSVYCLAGANGLGKTTFLNAINYCLTGIVLEPDKEVYSPGEIIKSNSGYTERYFKGRIQKKDEEKAEIEIHFSVNNKEFRITRGFFERDELRQFEMFSVTGKKYQPLFSPKNLSPKELNSQYQKNMVTEIGFINFDYFMFYQLYILTFDENRRMIFWDDRASSNALSVAFNSDPRDAEKISDLTRRIEKHESLGRNARWQATQAKNQIKELTEKIGGKKGAANYAKLEAEFNRLYKDVDKTEKAYNNIKIELDTMLKRQSYLNSEVLQLRNEHAKLFSRYSKPRSKMLEHVNVQLALKKHECCVCGSHGTYVVENIEKNIYKDSCPLCNTPINDSNNAEQSQLFKQIQKHDEKIADKTAELDELIVEIEGKQLEVEKAQITFENAKAKVDEFTEDNPELSLATGDKKIDSLIEQYRNQFKVYDEKAIEEYASRDKLKPEYERLLKKVEQGYREAQTVFVPTFKKLAKSFIGLDLNIQPTRSNKGIKLILELQDTARTESFQLSESQRFFLDIALRMSLAIFLSAENNGATMLIDTPEGSLDIAYESRVGNMFADFAVNYDQNIFMTANINASQLIIALAEKCGKKTMTFKRMLEWTDPSEIQQEGEKLFKQVYKRIDIALNKRK